MYYNKFLIIGGDLRNISLADHLICDGKKVEVTGFSKYRDEQQSKIIFSKSLKAGIKNCEVIIGPTPCCRDKTILNAPFNEKNIKIQEVFDAMEENQLYIAGMISEEVLALAKEKNVKIFDILKRDEMTILNAIPTAEGAIQIAFEEMKITLHESNAMVLGYGRVGKILTHMLQGIGANVYTVCRKFQDSATIRSYGYTPIFFSQLPDYLGKMDVIFNTVPSTVLDKSNLKFINKNCIVIDLASKPFGIDFEASKSEDLKVMWANSLPGKVAPVTAASYIKETVYNIINEMVV